MRKMLLIALLGAGLSAQAEKLNCEVKGPHCDGCKDMIEGQVCEEGKYTTCAVKIKDPKKKLAELQLVTKDEKAKVDQATLAKTIEKMDYKLATCKKSS
jgi:hypothetical protein